MRHQCTFDNRTEREKQIAWQRQVIREETREVTAERQQSEPGNWEGKAK